MALTIPDELLPRTADPRCAHFGECGGCSFQDVPYDAQLAAKRSVIEEHLGRTVEIVPSPNPWGYRHRMDYVTAFGKIGLRKRGDGKQVIDLNECHIVPQRVSDLLPDLHTWLDELGIRGWNLVTKRGDLRYITFRHAFSSDQLMVILVTFRRDSSVQPVAERLAEHVESVVWSVQERVGDDSHGEVQKVWGRETLDQSIGDFTFEISPGCFFQNNLLLVDRMYQRAASYVNGYTFDLFCGTGTIGIYASRQADKVLGVEVVPENIELAKRNLERNAVDNVEYVLDNANHFLAHYDGSTPDTVILDPPRSGLAPKLIRKLNRLGAKRIVYVSCNPKTFTADLEQFEGYELMEAEAYDMFPQTPHAELVTLLERQDVS
ncbi:23S rRNA (uracil(1939)-C(5))-methyltransferase RlmD [bacterium]|nr:23S rRNA (uracil(1939)-C(5))-methyltransferase RlmD [bacterium]